MCCWQPLSSSWSAASFSSGSESDPPVAFIHQGLLCPGMSLTLAPSLITPTEAGMWGAGVNLGQIPRESTTPNNTQPPSSFSSDSHTDQNSSPITILPVLTITLGQRHTQTPKPLSREKWKAVVVIYCSINASCGRPIRQQAPLFAVGPRDNSEFSALKQVLTPNPADFPGENKTLFASSCVCFLFLNGLELIFVNWFKLFLHMFFLLNFKHYITSAE